MITINFEFESSKGNFFIEPITAETHQLCCVLAEDKIECLNIISESSNETWYYTEQLIEQQL